MNPRNLNENYADYYTYENNDGWWHQLDLDKERQADELLRADLDRKEQALNPPAQGT